MHPSVSEAWPAFAAHFEGVCDFLYLDTRALVTTGVGFLMDEGTGHAPEACLKLPWIDQGVPATRTQIGAAWNFVKARTDLAPKGGFAFQSLTTVRLPAQAINALLTAKTLDFWSVLSAQLPGLEQWPADAQLALIDMGWHFGPHFLGPNWPNFTAAAHAEDFTGMATHCQTANRTPRDARHVRLFSNAAQVIQLGIDPGRLWDDLEPKQEAPVTYFNEKVHWKDTGYLLDPRTRDQLLEVEHTVGHSIVMYQGSWAKGVLSAETHAGAGAADIGGGNWWELETVCRKVGMAAWYRHTGTWTNNQHIHALSIGNPYLAPWAKKQVEAYKAGYNGLGPDARSGRDDGIRSYVDITWEEYMPTAADIAKATVAEQIRRGPELGKAIAKGFLTADDIVASGKDEPDQTNKFQAPKTFVTNDHDLLVDIRAALEKLAGRP